MFVVLKEWYNNFFATREATNLFIFIIIILLLFAALGSILKPVIVAAVIAYLLMGLVRQLEKIKVPHILAVLLVFLGFVAAVVFMMVAIVPLLWQQLINLLAELPHMLVKLQQLIGQLPTRISQFITPDQVQQVSLYFKTGLGKLGQFILSYSLATIPSVISLIIYFILVPFLAYFFLMDRVAINNWLSQFLPRKHALIDSVWEDINLQFGKYIQGRMLQVIIVTTVSFVAYIILGLQYAFLLAFATGVSAIVPYIGTVVVAIPVLLVGLFQWGWTAQLAYLTITYGVITLIAGNILEPILLSEAVNLHPVAIIVAILVFGAWFGFWGIFFAIPLATVVKALIKAWPHH